MNDLPATITALAALVAAVGGIVAATLSYLNRRGAVAAKLRAEEAARAAVEAKAAAGRASDEIMIVKGEVRSVGERIDGRLSELLRVSIASARAEGVAAGEQSQRDRAAESDEPHRPK